MSFIRWAAGRRIEWSESGPDNLSWIYRKRVAALRWCDSCHYPDTVLKRAHGQKQAKPCTNRHPFNFNLEPYHGRARKVYTLTHFTSTSHITTHACTMQCDAEHPQQLHFSEVMLSLCHLLSLQPFCIPVVPLQPVVHALTTPLSRKHGLTHCKSHIVYHSPLSALCTPPPPEVPYAMRGANRREGTSGIICGRMSTNHGSLVRMVAIVVIVLIVVMVAPTGSWAHQVMHGQCGAISAWSSRRI